MLAILGVSLTIAIICGEISQTVRIRRQMQLLTTKTQIGQTSGQKTCQTLHGYDWRWTFSGSWVFMDVHPQNQGYPEINHPFLVGGFNPF